MDEATERVLINTVNRLMTIVNEHRDKIDRLSDNIQSLNDKIDDLEKNKVEDIEQNKDIRTEIEKRLEAI